MIRAARTLRLALALAAGAVGSAGCASDGAAPAGAPAGAVRVDDAPEGAAVLLRPVGTTEGDVLTAAIVLRGAGRTQGVALKLRHDAEALALEAFTPAADVARDGLRLGKASAPGEISVVVTELGDASFDAAGERVLGTLTLRVRARRGALEPVPSRSRVALESGAAAKVAYAGLRFE